ncbi:MAG: hypothetical protein OXN96_10910 [Bryobacterales bacterium]|nr:hypothetical protein [Bryobacterales bacterium]
MAPDSIPAEDTACKRVLAAIPDLFFGSKVSGTAKQLGISVRFAGSRQALVEAAHSRPDLVIVDLDATAVDPLGVVGELRSFAPSGAPRLIAFASHVRESVLQQARSAGYDEVLTRGALAANLPGLLASLRSGRPEGSVRSPPG